MWSLDAKALLAGAMVAAIAEIGKRLPAMAALVAPLPLALGCALTIVLYLLMMQLGPRLGLRL